MTSTARWRSFRASSGIGRTVAAFVPLVATWALCSIASAQETKPPKRAASPFRVHVTASAKGEPEVVEKISGAVEELEKRLSKNKKWFRLVSDPADAEISVDLHAYWVREERRTHDQRHVAGSATHTVQVDTIYRIHSLRSIATFFGASREMTATQTKRGGGNAKGAARDLAKRLERYCRDHYWELEAKQRP